jgi:hypothetical protein
MHPDDGLNVMRVLAIQAHSASSEVRNRGNISQKVIEPFCCIVSDEKDIRAYN